MCHSQYLAQNHAFQLGMAHAHAQVFEQLREKEAKRSVKAQGDGADPAELRPQKIRKGVPQQANASGMLGVPQKANGSGTGGLLGAGSQAQAIQQLPVLPGINEMAPVGAASMVKAPQPQPSSEFGMQKKKKWRKYGEKRLKVQAKCAAKTQEGDASEVQITRSYFRCKLPGSNVRKQVEHSVDDPENRAYLNVRVTGNHVHQVQAGSGVCAECEEDWCNGDCKNQVVIVPWKWQTTAAVAKIGKTEPAQSAPQQSKNQAQSLLWLPAAGASAPGPSSQFQMQPIRDPFA